jgi:uncharacterized protein
MKSLRIPDVNVWMAILLADHVHRSTAKDWWKSDNAKAIGFCRFTQLGVLRLLTTSAAMNGRPLTMLAAWKAYERLFMDERLVFIGEAESTGEVFRGLAMEERPSPKLWADAWLLAMAETSDCDLVTFDRGLASRSVRCRLLT